MRKIFVGAFGTAMRSERPLNTLVVPLDGNIQSVVRAFHASVANDPSEIKSATHLIIPGVGSFGSLDIADDWRLAIREYSLSGMPVLGICLGMQALGDSSEEGEGVGLGIMPGRSMRLPRMRMGWDRVIGFGDVYFCHQYEFFPINPDHVWLKTISGVVAGVRDKNIIGVQFHPEKSGRVGKKFIEDFLIAVPSNRAA